MAMQMSMGARAPGPDAGRLALGGAMLLVVGTFTVVSVCDLAFLAGLSLGPSLAQGALLAALLAAAFTVHRIDRVVLLPAAVLTAAVVAAAMLGTRLHPDGTQDGIYHLSAIDALLRGWNPVWHSYTEVRRPGEAMEFIEIYGKASWVLVAAQIKAGLGTEAAKCAALYLPVAAGLAAFGVARRFGVSITAALAIGAVAAANPVALQEFWTRMNDGQMTALVTMFVAGQLLWTVHRDPRGLVLALPAMAVAINMKLSSAPVMVVLCAFAVLAELRVHGRRQAGRSAAVLLGTGLVAIAVLGASPYIRSLASDEIAQAPLSRDGWSRMMEGDWPDGFEALPGWQRWQRSFFAATDYVVVREKLPLSLSREEIANAGDVEVMVAALGPLFSAAALLAALLAGWSLIATRRSPRDPARAVLGILAAGLAAASMLMPQSWYFRYVPHLWLVPVALALSAAIGSRARTAGAGIVLAVLLANSALVGLSALGEAELVPARLGALLWLH